MKTRRLALALVVAVATFVGCASAVDQLNAPLASLTDLESLDQLNSARPGDPVLIVAAYDGLSAFNEHLLGSMPLEATLRVEDAIAGAAIALTSWQPASTTAPAQPEQPTPASAEAGPQVASADVPQS